MSNIGPNGSLNSDKFIRALLQLRNTPDPDCNLSPAQIIFGRPIRDSLSFVNRLEKFSNPHVRPMWREAWAKKESALRTRFTRSSEALNEHAKQLQPLSIGEKCFIQNQTGNFPTKWHRTGTVVEVCNHDQYVLKVDGSGRLTKRNRRFLRSPPNQHHWPLIMHLLVTPPRRTSDQKLFLWTLMWKNVPRTFHPQCWFLLSHWTSMKNPALRTYPILIIICLYVIVTSRCLYVYYYFCIVNCLSFISFQCCPS